MSIIIRNNSLFVDFIKKRSNRNLFDGIGRTNIFWFFDILIFWRPITKWSSGGTEPLNEMKLNSTKLHYLGFSHVYSPLSLYFFIYIFIFEKSSEINLGDRVAIKTQNWLYLINDIK